VSLLPDPSAPHNRLVQVTAFDTVHAADAASGRIAQAGRTSLPEPFSIHLLAEEVPVHGSRTTH
jgi:RNA polymerase sigma-32 factor